jgi:hypothetical protein
LTAADRLAMAWRKSVCMKDSRDEGSRGRRSAWMRLAAMAGR